MCDGVLRNSKNPLLLKSFKSRVEAVQVSTQCVYPDPHDMAVCARICARVRGFLLSFAGRASERGKPIRAFIYAALRANSARK